MRKSLVALAVSSLLSTPVLAQTAPATNQVQPAKPLTVKKRVCEITEEDSYSRLGGRKICRTIEVQVKDPQNAQQPAQQQQPEQQQQPNSGY